MADVRSDAERTNESDGQRALGPASADRELSRFAAAVTLNPQTGEAALEQKLVLLGHTIEQRDPTTSGHCERLRVLCLLLGMALGLSAEDLEALGRGAFLHDIGKLYVPDHILFKPGPLTDEEFAIMRLHTIQGEKICREVAGLAPVLPIIRSHHEHWDGSGYPDGMAGLEIPLLARILQVADIYDALTSARPYKPAYSGEQALQIIEEESRRGWRDARLVRLLRAVHPQLRRDTSASLSHLGAALARQAPAARPR